MNTLSITGIKRQAHLSVVTICEVDRSGNRDGFKDVKIQHESCAASPDDAADIEAALQSLAKERGLAYE